MTKIWSNKLAVISFDLDNALYDNLPVINNAETVSSTYLAEEFNKQNLVYDFKNYLSVREKLLATCNIQFENLTYFRKIALQQFCSGLENAEQIADKALKLFVDRRSRVEIPSEIDNLLANLSKKYILVSVTNGNCEMSQLSIAGYFTKNYSTSQNYRAKPHPQMLQQVINDFNIQSSQLIHVGDSLEKDGGAAKNANVDFFYFSPFEEKNSIQKYCDLFKIYLEKNNAL